MSRTLMFIRPRASESMRRTRTSCGELFTSPAISRWGAGPSRGGVEPSRRGAGTMRRGDSRCGIGGFPLAAAGGGEEGRKTRGVPGVSPSSSSSLSSSCTGEHRHGHVNSRTGRRVGRQAGGGTRRDETG